MGTVKNILLTGATGYLGSHLATHFVESGYNLVVLKRKNSSLLKISHLLDKINTYNVEDLDFDTLFQKENIDAIAHTAASYGKKNESLVDIYNSNLFFPLQLFEYALKYNVKYFFNANTTLPPDLNVYALSKKQFSDILKINANQIKVIDVLLQYFYGPADESSKFVTFIISKLKTNADFIDLSPAIQIRDFIYIDDVVSAYSILLKHCHSFENYISVSLGSGRGITLKSLIEKIKANFGNSKTILNFGALPLREGEVMYSIADTEFLNKLGWQPQFSIDEGIKRTIGNSCK